jgi:hypothetical protein
VFRDEAAGAQFGNQRVVDRRTIRVIESLQGFVAGNLSLANSLCEVTLITTGHFVLDQKCEEVRVGKLGLDRLLVSGSQRIEDAGQPELLEHWFELRHGIHGRSPKDNGSCDGYCEEAGAKGSALAG